MAPFGGGCGEELTYYETSSDGRWLLCNVASGITVIGRDGTRWQFSYNEILGSGLEAITVAKSWTTDGKYLYFSPMVPSDGGVSLGFLNRSAYALFRMDLGTGDVSAIIAGTGDYDAIYAISFSPTGRRLAYCNNGQHPLQVNILDLQTGTTLTIPVDLIFSQGGNFTWNPDGTRMTFGVYASNPDPNQAHDYWELIDLTTVYLVDFQAGGYTPVMSNYTGYLTVQSLDEENRLTYFTPADTFVRVLNLDTLEIQVLGTQIP
jgi:WD40 repeat protein